MFGAKAAERFSLLLLEEDEFFVRDYSADYVRAGETNSKWSGRLKVCSHSVVFDPEDIRQPLLRLPLRHMTRIGKYERGPLLELCATSEVLMLQCGETIKMKQNNRDVPYTFEKARRRLCLSVCSLNRFLRSFVCSAALRLCLPPFLQRRTPHLTQNQRRMCKRTTLRSSTPTRSTC